MSPPDLRSSEEGVVEMGYDRWWWAKATPASRSSEGELAVVSRSSERGVVGGWNSPSVTRNVSRVAVAMKTLRLTFRVREGSVMGGIPIRHSKCEWSVIFLKE